MRGNIRKTFSMTLLLMLLLLLLFPTTTTTTTNIITVIIIFFLHVKKRLTHLGYIRFQRNVPFREILLL